MATIHEALKGVNAYPIPLRTITETAEGRGLSLADEATAAVMHGKAFSLATADLLLWLSLAPNVSQGGQSFSFTDEQRTRLRQQAQAIYDEYDDAGGTGTGVKYGYKGSSL